MAKHLLSICIPTNGVSRWVIPTLDNLYSLGADETLFEVVVADNGGEASDLADAITEFATHANFRYVKTEAKGFYNIIENFLLAKGDYMIKLNHRCILHKGMIEHIYETAEKYYNTKPLMYFSNKALDFEGIMEYDTFDGYLEKLTFFSSLSQGLFFWKEDLQRVPDIKFAKMSPNVSLMFDSRNKEKFILDNTRICHEQDSKGKYGYDLFDTFAVLYLDLINEVRADGSITKQTFIKIKQDLFDFLSKCYRDIKCDGMYENYGIDGMKESLSVYYSKWDYYFLVWRVKYYDYPLDKYHKIKNKLLNPFRLFKHTLAEKLRKC